MKVAEALAERSDCQKRIEEIRNRLDRSARIQEGEQPAEDPGEFVLSERDSLLVLSLLENPPAPNAKLRAAIARMPKPTQKRR